LLDARPPADAFAGLRIFEDCVVFVDLMLRGEIVGVGSRPMPLQGGSHVVIAHRSFLQAIAPAALLRATLSEAREPPAEDTTAYQPRRL
jgi:hypothetical protein